MTGANVKNLTGKMSSRDILIASHQQVPLVTALFAKFRNRRMEKGPLNAHSRMTQ